MLRDALRKQGRVAVAKVTLREREIVAVLRVHDEVLVLATMLWPDEVREPRFGFQAGEAEWSTPSEELAMAEALIDSLSDQQLDPDRYRDVHRETLTALIDAKASGRTVASEGEPGAPPLDLLNALRASIEAAKQRRSTGNGGRRRPSSECGGHHGRRQEEAEEADGETCGTRTRCAQEAGLASKAGTNPKKSFPTRPNQSRTMESRGGTNSGMSGCPECGLDSSDLDASGLDASYIGHTYLDHCHGTLIVHRDRSVECTSETCELPDLLRHAFIVDCIALGGCCRDEETLGFAAS